METTTTKQQNSEVLASDVLLTILVNLKYRCGKKQLFMKIRYSDFHLMFWLPSVFDEFLAKHFIYSNSGPSIFSPSLQKAIEQLQFGGLICWPDIQEPDLMRLNPSAESYYNEELLSNTDKKLPPQDFISIQKVVDKFMEGIVREQLELIVDRPHLMNC